MEFFQNESNHMAYVQEEWEIAEETVTEKSVTETWIPVNTDTHHAMTLMLGP